MSLINDALQRARQEAARRDAARRGLPLPSTPPASHSKGLTVAVAALALALIASLAAVFALYRQGRTPEPEIVAAAPAPVAEVRSERLSPSDPDAGLRPDPLPEPDPGPDTRPEVLAPSDPAAETDPDALRTANAATADRPGTPPPAPAAEGGGREARTEEPEVSSPSRLAVEASPPRDREPPVPSEGSSPNEQSSYFGDAGISASPSPRSRSAGRAAEEPTGGAGAGTEPSETPTFVRHTVLADGSSIELGGIAWSEEGPFALLNGNVVGVGEPVEGYTVLRIEPQLVELAGEAGNIVIRLK